MLISDMTSIQIELEMDVNANQGKPNVAVIPTGSVEQHGPLLPLNTDTFIAEAMALELDQMERGRLFVYPALEYTNADSGMDFAGNLTVRHETFRRIVRDISESVIRQKYDALLFLDAHALNRAGLNEISFELVDKSFRENRPVLIMVLGVYDFFGMIGKKYQLKIGQHADWFERLLFRASGGALPHVHAESLHRCPRKKARIPGVVGIPLSERSDRGVIGELFDDQDTEKLESDVWRDLRELFHQNFKQSLKDFLVRFGPVRKVMI